jgi:uncharacterized protein YwgA
MSNSKLVYSNDLCSAFLTSVVKAFEGRHPAGYLGRTSVQKLTYFIQVLGAPIPCSFGIYTYGPYSDKVTFAVESLLADDVIQDRSTNPKYSNYRLGVNAQELLSKFEDDLRPHEDQINHAVEVLGSFVPNELELIATLHFIANRQLRTQGDVSKPSVIKEFKSIKHEKFKDSEIDTWYDALTQAGLIS